jgi:NAD(P)-dependent dehydrogenase (short-subunit alcohol dehydrogenase family)
VTGLDGHAIVVTGGGRGLGAGIAEAILEAGGRVTLVDLVPGRAAACAERLDPAGEDTLAIDADVRDGPAMRAVVDATCGRWGALDGWVNNAGVIAMNPALDVRMEDWDRQFETNTRAVFVCCQIAAASMIERGTGGAIVNISSRAAKVPYGDSVAYNASKSAVLSITRSLSEELAPHGINVNAVCPTTIDTDMLVEVATYLAPRQGRTVDAVHADMTTPQLGRKLQPIEVGRVVAFLLSDAAKVIRGQAINADAGEAPW